MMTYDKRVEQARVFYRTTVPASDPHEQDLFATGYAEHLEAIDQPRFPDLPLPTPADFALEYDIFDLTTI